MIGVFCLLVVLGLGHGQDIDLPSSVEVERSINRTIDEVERLVNQNSSLPRLSREQIVRILYNITSKDLDTDAKVLQKTREMYHRALMVVLPYNAQDSPGNLKDLYTKPPVTRLISDSDEDKVATILENEKKGQVVHFDNFKDSKEENARENAVVTHVSEKSAFKVTRPTITKTQYKNHRESYSDVRIKPPTGDNLKVEHAPMKFSFSLDNFMQDFYATSTGSPTRHPVFHPPTTNTIESTKPNLQIVYSTSVSSEPTTKMIPKEVTIDLQKPKSTIPTFEDQYILTAEMDSKKYPETVAIYPTAIRIMTEDGPMKPSKSDRVKDMQADRPAPVYVTPTASTTPDKVKQSTTHNFNSGGFQSVAATVVTPMRPEVMDLLAAIGLRPDNNSNVEDVYKKNKKILETNAQIADSNNLFHTTTVGLTAVGVESPSITSQNTFENPEMDYRKGMDNLTPDVQLLFQRFGLQTSKDLTSTTTTTKKPTINVNSYTNFKPLPTSKIKDQEMKDFLAKFGLGVNEHRHQKAVNIPTTPQSLIEAVPNNMRNILENIGLITPRRKPVKSVINSEKDMDFTDTSKFHVFKPHEAIVKDDAQKMKINQLLDTVRLVQQGKANVQDVQKAASNLLETTRTLKDGPDPLSLEEIIQIYNEDLKNEVKRQEQQEKKENKKIEEVVTTTTGAPTNEDGRRNLSSIASTESVSTSTQSTTTTIAESAKTATDSSDSTTTTSSPFLDQLAAMDDSVDSATKTDNLAALEESFGGSTSAPDPVLPTKRRNGLYFLVDWNTFLEVGEEGGERVNLRFEPKVGDKSRFLKVTVP